ncbi:Poly(A) RNA polymerase protein 1 [Yarrowia sp. C11]|nr:Poly(A) RNA polymerase protein 1 [Yarrowia sp. E02]KAG5371331.1 Poly(A) RNA polymerase protein 1 [Yarrowia sp. C11]
MAKRTTKLPPATVATKADLRNRPIAQPVSRRRGQQPGASNANNNSNNNNRTEEKRNSTDDTKDNKDGEDKPKKKKRKKAKKKNQPGPSSPQDRRNSGNGYDVLAGKNDDKSDDGSERSSKKRRTAGSAGSTSVSSDSDSDDDNQGSASTAPTSAPRPPSGSPPPPPADPSEWDMNEDFVGFDFSDGEEDEEDTQPDEPVRSRKRTIEEVDDVSSGPATKKQDLEAPWIKSNYHQYDRVSDWLQEEVMDFVKYISPTQSEIKARQDLVERVRGAVNGLWADAKVHVLGSFTTNMHLPQSDIDLVVCSPHGHYGERACIYQLSSVIRSRMKVAELQTITKARVPIIKFIDSRTGVHVDISFEKDGGIKTASTITNWSKTMPALRPLVLIVKQFLSSRRLNEVFTGGLGGFSVICMVYSFLIQHPRISTGDISPMDNLGVLLIEFFELYGVNFNYERVALNMDGSCGYLSKRLYPDLVGRNPFAVAIRDPDDHENNISQGTFNMRNIKRAFSGAFQLLSGKCLEMNKTGYKGRQGKSLLTSIIKLKGPVRDQTPDAITEPLMYTGGGDEFKIPQDAVYNSVLMNDEDEEERAKQAEDANKAKKRVAQKEEQKKKESLKKKELSPASDNRIPNGPAADRNKPKADQSKKTKDRAAARAATREVMEISSDEDNGSDNKDGGAKSNPIDLSSDEEKGRSDIKKDLSAKRRFWQQKGGLDY